MATKNLKTGAWHEHEKTDVPSSNHFLVKIQVPTCITDGKLMIYNKDRSFLENIRGTEASFQKLVQQIREKGPLGAKGFFYAIWKEGDLKINTTDMQAAQTWRYILIITDSFHTIPQLQLSNK